MRKLKLFFAALALLVGGSNSVWAQGWTASEVGAGDFYLYNVGANAYLENGSSWGTHAALKSSGFVVNVTAGNGVYTIGTNSKYSGKFFTDNGYVDTGNSTNWTFEAVPGLANTYKLKTAAGQYAYAAAGMYNLEIGNDPGTNKAYWQLVTAANRDDVSGASATNPIELTHKINNPRFDDNNSGWQNAPDRGGNTSGTNNDVPSWDNFNPCAEHYNKTYDTYQELTGLNNGVYAISVQGFYREGGYVDAASKHNAGTESLNAIFYANSAEQPLMSIFEEAGKASGGATVTTEGISGAFPNMRDAASYFFSAGLYWNTVYVEVTDGTLKFGVKKSTAVGADWTVIDNFRLQYFGNCSIEEAKFGSSISALAAAVSEAQAYIDSNPVLSTEQIAALQQTVYDNDNDDNAFKTKEEFDSAIENIETALVAYKAMVAPYAAFNALKTSANAIAAVEYTETASDSHNIFTDAINTQTENVENATSTETIETAITTIIAAIKTYIAGAEPKNDDEYFDITCLMTNPNFDDSHNGWTKNIDPGVNWSNCEYYEKEFDINQTVTGLPTGSYSLSVQAFQRPGWAGDVYTDYVNGTDNASSVLYINSITSNVKNIAADAQSTGKLGDDSNWGSWPNDSRVGSEGNYKYVPNSQQGANLYFGAGLYDATCAAVVTDEDGGSLKLGFKSTKTHVDGDWTIFDNFRLYYYGSSLLVYYKQYLPQLEAEIAANYLNNAAYAVLKEGQTQRTALATANSAKANELNTEEELENAINAITAARTAFVNAKNAYDNLALGLAASTYNEGDGVFQMSSANKATYDEAVSAGTLMYNTGTASGTQVTAQILRIKNAYVLNEPVAGTHYNLIVATENHPKNGNAVIIFSGETSDNNPTGYGLNANLAINNNLKTQAVTFTKVISTDLTATKNDYNISFETAEGTAYLTYGKTNGSAADWANSQIQATTDADKKGVFTIVATNTENVFNIVNTITKSTIACQQKDNGNIYTETGNADFTIAEASEASVSITIDANVKLATRIFPFTVTLPEGVKAFSCDGVNEGVLELTEVVTLEANVPYILYAKEGYDGALTGWGTATDTKYTEGLLTGVYVTTPAPVGSWVLQNQDGDVSFYKVGENQPTVGANRAYLTPEGQSPARLSFPFEDELTAINAIKAMTSSKFEIFNVSGAKLPALQKGMNILKTNDGRSLKVMVK